MALDKNKSTKLVKFPDGKIISEYFDQGVAPTVLGRNRVNHIVSMVTTAETVNMETVFNSDPEDREYPINRVAGDRLVFFFHEDDGSGFNISFGTGFVVNTPIIALAADTIAVVTFEYKDQIGNSPAGFYKVSEVLGLAI